METIDEKKLKGYQYDSLVYRYISLAHIKSHGKKVRCIETGEIFNCIADACEKLGKKEQQRELAHV